MFENYETTLYSLQFSKSFPTKTEEQLEGFLSDIEPSENFEDTGLDIRFSTNDVHNDFKKEDDYKSQPVLYSYLVSGTCQGLFEFYLSQGFVGQQEKDHQSLDYSYSISNYKDTGMSYGFDFGSFEVDPKK